MAIQLFTLFVQQHVKNMGFIRVIYANNRKIMAIRATTAKYGSLTGKKKTYGVPGYVYIYNIMHAQNRCDAERRRDFMCNPGAHLPEPRGAGIPGHLKDQGDRAS